MHDVWSRCPPASVFADSLWLGNGADSAKAIVVPTPTSPVTCWRHGDVMFRCARLRRMWTWPLFLLNSGGRQQQTPGRISRQRRLWPMTGSSCGISPMRLGITCGVRPMGFASFSALLRPFLRRKTVSRRLAQEIRLSLSLRGERTRNAPNPWLALQPERPQPSTTLPCPETDWILAASWPPSFTWPLLHWLRQLRWSDPLVERLTAPGTTFLELLFDFIAFTAVLPPVALNDVHPPWSSSRFERPRTVTQMVARVIDATRQFSRLTGHA